MGFWRRYRQHLWSFGQCGKLEPRSTCSPIIVSADVTELLLRQQFAALHYVNDSADCVCGPHVLIGVHVEDIPRETAHDGEGKAGPDRKLLQPVFNVKEAAKILSGVQ